MVVDLKTVQSFKGSLIRERLRGGGVSPLVVEGSESVLRGERVSRSAGLALYVEAPLDLLALLAQYVRVQFSGDAVYYNRNAHVEPTNVCRFDCSFCSFRRDRGEEGSWSLSLDEVVSAARDHLSRGVTEIHITGGVHPDWSIEDLERILRSVRALDERVHIKAFSAVELVSIFETSGVGYREGLGRLRAAGLGSIPGGGAEIFAEGVRARICPRKASGEAWLAFHEEAHRQGLTSNATMLFGHVETYEDRVDHLDRLRTLQDSTGGFNAFIPLKYRSMNNRLGGIGEVGLVEVLRNFAVCRVLLDNIPHLKAYWPMLGKREAGLALLYGADDLDGTIMDSTQIYAMAGAHDRRPSATESELAEMIRSAGFRPVERDSLYRAIVRERRGEVEHAV